MYGRRRPTNVDNSRFYEILGVSKDCSTDELKKAYRKAAIKNHPDKGGDPEKFKELAHAYEILNDPEKRKIYDEYGEEALKEGLGGGGGPGMQSPFDIFDTIFGMGGSPFGGGRGSRRNYQRRGDDVTHALKVSLEDLYNGTTKKLSLSRNVICQKCKGIGSKTGAAGKCAGCQGSGIKVVIRQLHGNMIQHTQQACHDCGGTGEFISEKDRCTQCKGQKVVPEKKMLDVHVEKGMLHNQKITFQGEADEKPDHVTGDIIFIVQQKEHAVFKRKNDNDLFIEKEIALSEALCGFQFSLTHLDGRKLLVKTSPGEIITPGEDRAISDEGMPIYQRPTLKGQLYIRFLVKFPEPGSLSIEQCKILESVLPPKSPSNNISLEELAECEETTLHKVNMDEEHHRSASDREAYDEDDDMGPQRVQCAQQ